MVQRTWLANPSWWIQMHVAVNTENAGPLSWSELDHSKQSVLHDLLQKNNIAYFHTHMSSIVFSSTYAFRCLSVVQGSM
jgi:hypothetical protein